MSELLGWYGYDKVDSGCTRGLNLDHFTPLSSARHTTNQRLSYQGAKNYSASRLSSAIDIKRLRNSRSSRLSPVSISIISTKENGTAFLEHSSPLRATPTSPRIPENSDSASDTPGK